MFNKGSQSLLLSFSLLLFFFYMIFSLCVYILFVINLLKWGNWIKLTKSLVINFPRFAVTANYVYQVKVWWINEWHHTVDAITLQHIVDFTTDFWWNCALFLGWLRKCLQDVCIQLNVGVHEHSFSIVEQ